MLAALEVFRDSLAGRVPDAVFPKSEAYLLIVAKGHLVQMLLESLGLRIEALLRRHLGEICRKCHCHRATDKLRQATKDDHFGVTEACDDVSERAK